MIRRTNALLFPILLFTSCILMVSCGADKSKKNTAKVQDSLAHDPYSAPLHAASKKSKAPDFKTELLNGQTFRLSDQRGKVVLLNIWATWCPPCKEETPALVDIYENYHDKGVEFLGISIDEQGKSVVKPFVKKYDVNYPITIDDGSIMEKYGPMMGVPTTYIVDQEGNLRYFATGAVTKKEIKPRLEKLLAK